MIKAIVFDRARVLTYPQNSKYIKYLSKTSGLKEETTRKIFVPLNDTLGIGRISLYQFEKRLASKLGIPKKKIRYKELSEKNFKLDKDMLKLAQSLRKSYKVACLTGVSITRYRFFRKKINKGLFDKMFATCYLHMSKDDKRIYLHVLGKLSVAPEEMVFIDDDERYIRVAKELGINCVHFKGIRQLRKKLHEIGVTLPQ